VKNPQQHRDELAFSVHTINEAESNAHAEERNHRRNVKKRSTQSPSARHRLSIAPVSSHFLSRQNSGMMVAWVLRKLDMALRAGLRLS
jgi:hypothetical protein